MTTLTYNNFKSTTVRGIFQNVDDTTNSILANTIIERDIHIGGNIYSNSVQCSSGFVFNTTTTDFSGNIIPFEICKLSVTDSTFNNTINCPAIKINNVDLITLLLDYITYTYLTSTLSNYVLTSTLSNLTIPKLTFTNSTSVKQLMLYNVNAAKTQNNLCISVENGILRYNINHPTNDSHVFSCANNSSSATAYIEILRLKSTSSTFYTRLYVPSITLNGVDLVTTLSNYVLTTALNTSLLDYVTQIDFQNLSISLNDYALNSELINYVNFTNLSTSLSSYVTNTSLTTTLNSYALISSLSGYLTSASLSNYALTSTLNNYVLTSSLDNLVISTLTFNNSVSVKHLMLYNINASTNYNNLCISIEPGTLRYNNNDPNVDVHLFSCANHATNATAYIDILRLKSTGSTLYNRLYVPSITLNGVDLETTLSGYANLTATSNTFTGNVIFSTGNVDIGTINSPMNQYLDVYSVATFMKIATFQEGLIADTMVFNSADLQTTLDTFVTNTSLTTLLMNYITASALNTSLSNYVTNTSLTTSLSNYVTNTTISNYTLTSALDTKLKTLNYTAGLGFNATTFPTNSSGDYKYGYECFWNVSNGGGEMDFLSYGQGGLGGFKFYAMNTASTSSTPYELMYMHPSIGTKINTNLTITGIQNSCRKSITYLNSNFFLTVANITAHYIITNNATIYFNCFAPTQNVTDGYEINIRNAGSGIVTITGCVPIGYNISTQTSTILIQNQSCKIISGHDSWYQI